VESGELKSPISGFSSNNGNHKIDEKLKTMAAVERLPGYCSICWGKDGHRDMKLQQCSDCGVLYHNDCYGRVVEEGEEPQACWACQAVGTTVKGRTRDGRHKTVTIESRPTECCLCSVNLSDIPLAMHPIYDRPKGRPLILEGTEDRVAFCHTLCAFVIGANASTGGCVYGVHKNGNYEGITGEKFDDDLSIASEFDDTDEDCDPSWHHFVIVMTQTRENEVYLDAIRQHQEELCCFVCNQNDQPKHVLRIPVQCMCNGQTEWAEFRQCRRKNDHCFTAMHVGCAIWGRPEQWPLLRRVYFNAGTTTDAPVVSNVFCDAHAQELINRGIKASKYKRFPVVDQARKRLVKDAPALENDVENTVQANSLSAKKESAEEGLESRPTNQEEEHQSHKRQRQSHLSKDQVEHTANPSVNGKTSQQSIELYASIMNEIKEKHESKTYASLDHILEATESSWKDDLIRCDIDNEELFETVRQKASEYYARDWSCLVVGKGYDPDKFLPAWDTRST
jgi:hypothetical protein